MDLSRPHVALPDADQDLSILTGDLRELRQMVAEQAEDEGLWFIAVTASEGYLQHELRRLHAAIERATRWVDA